MKRLNVHLIEPYFAGSHRAWAEGYQHASAHEVAILSLAGRFWKWRMHGAAVTIARRLREGAGARLPDVVLASDMLDLAALLGLARRELRGVPIALYMHENQISYPPLPDDTTWTDSRRQRAKRRDMHYPFVNLTSALAADLVLWNSAYNRDSFLQGTEELLRSFPDHSELGSVERIAQRSRVLRLGMDLKPLIAAKPTKRRAGPPRVLWNHRWEHDKDPATFFRALSDLASRGLEFEVIILGESFAEVPPVFADAREDLAGRTIQFGYAESRDEYARWLWDSDVVVSTARQEFFGAAICEAVFCGCFPVLPDRLAYPELVPVEARSEVLYSGYEELLALLEGALTRPSQQALSSVQAAVAEYDWSKIAPAYDSTMDELAAMTGTGHHV